MVELSGLNEAQKKAVVTTEGPVMILAGAGSGKTRTLVNRISYLIGHLGVSAHQVLALTFSNKAAKEMRERIASEERLPSGSLQVLTFHSFCTHVLRSEYSHLGLGRNFTIYDQSESKSIIKALLAQRGISPKQQSPEAILYFIEELKNQGYFMGRQSWGNPDSMTPNRSRFSSTDMIEQDEYFSYFREYEQELARSNAVDFGGLITGVLNLFERFPEVLERYQRRYKYILVDEYQDTNKAQFELVVSLCGSRRNICVVGDEDQSIYSWRGADIRNILDFDKVFPDTTLIKLEQNYRSSRKIIEAASYVISRNVARSGKTMWTENPEGDVVEVFECQSDREEADLLVATIKTLERKEGALYKDMAVFYRNNSQSRVLEECLRRNHIPYRIIGGIRFYERKEVKDLLAYLRLVVNSKDSLSLSRVINTPSRGIGVTSMRKLEAEAIHQHLSLWEVIVGIVRDGQQYSHLKLGGKLKSSLAEFVTLVEEGMHLAQAQALPSAIYEKILSMSGYMESLRASKDYESLSRIDNLEELFNAIKQYEQNTPSPSLAGFLENVTLNVFESEENQEDKGELSMMTVHGSKGLEFHYVFLVGVEENIFPSYKSMESGEMALEEERRLFYVAMTRAMKKLHLFFSLSRMLHGNLVFNGPSRFIYEIPENLYLWRKNSRFGNDHIQRDSLEYHDDEPTYDLSGKRTSPGGPGRGRPISCTYPPGSKVVHSLYGEGVVLESEGLGQEEKVLIAFPGGVRKKFMVKYAPLSMMENS